MAEGEDAPKKKRNLREREKTVYAPYASIGSLNFDRSSGYITIPAKHVLFTEMRDENNALLNEAQNEAQEYVRSLQKLDQTIDARFAEEDAPEEQP